LAGWAFREGESCLGDFGVVVRHALDHSREKDNLLEKASVDTEDPQDQDCLVAVFRIGLLRVVVEAIVRDHDKDRRQHVKHGTNSHRNDPVVRQANPEPVF